MCVCEKEREKERRRGETDRHIIIQTARERERVREREREREKKQGYIERENRNVHVLRVIEELPRERDKQLFMHVQKQTTTDREVVRIMLPWKVKKICWFAVPFGRASARLLHQPTFVYSGLNKNLLYIFLPVIN